MAGIGAEKKGKSALLLGSENLTLHGRTIGTKGVVGDRGADHLLFPFLW